MKKTQPSTGGLGWWFWFLGSSLWKGSLLRGTPDSNPKPPGPFSHQAKPLAETQVPQKSRGFRSLPTPPPSHDQTGLDSSPTRIVSQRLRSGCQEAATLNPQKWLVHRRKAPTHIGVSKNMGTPKSSILIGCSIINHPFWGTPIFGNSHMMIPGFTKSFK